MAARVEASSGVAMESRPAPGGRGEGAGSEERALPLRRNVVGKMGGL